VVQILLLLLLLFISYQHIILIYFLGDISHHYI